uniref:ATP synthase complex subunit 8 n=1 Tax=Xya japonica TaxID=1661859 RepID=A0A7L9QCY0_9ORTH|nr:ATP synthase F0 subunit 8 [Xya japonica]
MPQMAPLMWTSLFIIFSISLILFSILNFFSYYQLTPSSKKMKFPQSSLMWKW